MSYLGRRGAASPLTSGDIPADVVQGTDIAYLENDSTTQNLGGTYSTERMYLNDSYTLNDNVTVTGHLALGTIADSDVVITNDSSARTITGSGTLEAGRVMNDTPSLTGMTGELGSAVTGSPNLNLTTGSIGVGVTGGAGLSKVNFYEQWYVTSNFSGTDAVIAGWTLHPNNNFGTGTMSCDGTGYWTFPSTGYYKIDIKWDWNNGNSATTQSRWVEGFMQTRISSSNTIVQYAYNQIINGSGTDYASAFSTYIYDVTDTSTHLFFFGTQAAADMRTAGTISGTTATFLRLGDT